MTIALATRLRSERAQRSSKRSAKILRYNTEKERLDGLADAAEDVRRWVMLLETENGITDEELGEWVERKTVRQQRRIEGDK